MYSFSLGEGNTLVNYTVERVGRDFEVSITGGVVHIGCVALVSDGDYNVLSALNHREYELVDPLAEKLSRIGCGNVLIKAGVHIDNITVDEIREILSNNNVAVDMIVDFILSEK